MDAMFGDTIDTIVCTRHRLMSLMLVTVGSLLASGGHQTRTNTYTVATNEIKDKEINNLFHFRHFRAFIALTAHTKRVLL